MEDWNGVLHGPLAPIIFTITHLFLDMTQYGTHRSDPVNVNVKEECRDGAFFRRIREDLGEKSLQSI